MTTDEFNEAIEQFEINMLKMAPHERFDVLIDLTRDRHRITGRVYGITELLVILEQLTDSYTNLVLCRAICNQLFIYDN